jgi:4-carboxymuconolactone decarboxylase
MARLPLITSKDQLAPEHHPIADAIIASRGSLQGPFSIVLHSPELAERMAHLGAYVRFEGSLDMRARVLAAMTVAREFEAAYVWGAQTGAARQRGVAETTIAGDSGRPLRWRAAHGSGRDRIHSYPAAPASGQ